VRPEHLVVDVGVGDVRLLGTVVGGLRRSAAELPEASSVDDKRAL
jgi:hypothetical protein